MQNANQNGNFQRGICVGAIDFPGLGNWDTQAGTHAYIYKNYGINNQTSAVSAFMMAKHSTSIVRRRIYLVNRP